MAESYAHPQTKNPAVKASGKPKKEPAIDHLRIKGAVEGGHHVEVHHVDFATEPRTQHFPGPHAAVSLPAGHILHHIAGHLGIPVTGAGKDGESNEDGTE